MRDFGTDLRFIKRPDPVKHFFTAGDREQSLAHPLICHAHRLANRVIISVTLVGN
jgi:hypothetical protein